MWHPRFAKPLIVQKVNSGRDEAVLIRIVDGVGINDVAWRLRSMGTLG